MREHIGAFAAHAGVGQQGQGREKGREVAFPATRLNPAALPHEGAGQSECRKIGGGRAHREKGGRLNEGVGQVARRTAEQDQQPAEPGA